MNVHNVLHMVVPEPTAPMRGRVPWPCRRDGPPSKDVAPVAGVWLNTVSQVVRHGALVAPGTKVRVQAAIARLGYRPHAARLRSARSLTLSYLVPRGYETHTDAPGHPPDVYPHLDIFRDQLINAMTVKARGAGYYLLLDIFDEMQRGLELFKSAHRRDARRHVDER